MKVPVTSDDNMIKILNKIEKLFVCNLCGKTLASPNQIQCGHLFCGVCMKTKPTKQTTQNCPVCKGKYNRRMQKHRKDFPMLLEAFQKLVAVFESKTGGEGSQDDMRSNVLINGEATEDIVQTCVTNDSKVSTQIEEQRVSDISCTTQLSLKRSPGKNKISEKQEGNTPKTNDPIGKSMPIVLLSRLNMSNANSGIVTVNSDAPLDLRLKRVSQSGHIAKNQKKLAFKTVTPALALDLSRKTIDNSSVSAHNNAFKNGLYPQRKAASISNPPRSMFGFEGFDCTVLSLVPTVVSHRPPIQEPPAQPVLISESRKSSVPKSTNPEMASCPKIVLESMRSTDDFLFQDEELEDDAMIAAITPSPISGTGETSSGGILNTGKRLNDVVSIVDDIENPNGYKKRKVNVLEAEATNSSVSNFETPVANDVISPEDVEFQPVDSDNESEDMFLNTPTNSQRNPRIIHLRTSSPSKRPTTNKSGFQCGSPVKTPTIGHELELQKTPFNPLQMRGSPASGVISTLSQDDEKGKDAFDPFDDDFDDTLQADLQDAYSPKNSRITRSKILSPDKQPNNLVSGITPKKMNAMIANENAKTPSPNSRKSQKDCNILDSRTHVTPSRQYKGISVSNSQHLHPSPSRLLMGRAKSDQAYLSSLSPQRPTPSKCVQGFVFCPTRLSKPETNKLTEFCGMCGGKVVKDYSDDVTHLIPALEKGRVSQTMKYLLAIAGKKWIVSFEWVEECINRRKVVREEPFEVTSDPGVRKSRLATVPLLAGFTFYVLGSLESSGAKPDIWKKLLKKLGAKVISHSADVKDGVIIVGDSIDRGVDHQDWYDNHGVITVAWEWILDCVLNYEVLPLAKTQYLVTKLDINQLKQLTLPHQLIP